MAEIPRRLTSPISADSSWAASMTNGAIPQPRL